MGKFMKRCPKCRSSNIYKRIRCSVWVENTKSNRSNIEFSLTKTKPYICRRCKREFDKPIFGQRYIQNTEVNNTEIDNVDANK